MEGVTPGVRDANLVPSIKAVLALVIVGGAHGRPCDVQLRGGWEEHGSGNIEMVVCGVRCAVCVVVWRLLRSAR